MTKRKSPFQGNSDLELDQYRFRKIGMILQDASNLEDDLKSYLVRAFMLMGEGVDANEALGVYKPKKGEKRSKTETMKRDKMKLIMAWIATAIGSKEEYGLGLSLYDACFLAGEKWGYEPDYLINYWRQAPEPRVRPVQRPLSSFP